MKSLEDIVKDNAKVEPVEEQEKPLKYTGLCTRPLESFPDFLQELSEARIELRSKIIRALDLYDEAVEHEITAWEFYSARLEAEAKEKNDQTKIKGKSHE